MTPKFLAVAEIIENDIRMGTIRPGDRIPSMNMLAEQNHCSQSTILRALTRLKALGLIQGHQGKAVYTTHPREWN